MVRNKNKNRTKQDKTDDSVKSEAAPEELSYEDVQNRAAANGRKEELNVQGYIGTVPDIDLEAAKERASKYEQEVILPEKLEEAEKAQAEYKELIDTEKDFLEFFNDDKYKFRIEYGGRLFDIQISQIDPESNDLSILEMDTGEIMADLSSKEQKIINKVRAGGVLSEEEQKVMDNLATNPETAKMVFKNMNKVLAQQVIKPKLTEEQWKGRVDFAFRLFLYQEVMSRLGLDNKQQPALFQTS